MIKWLLLIAMLILSLVFAGLVFLFIALHDEFALFVIAGSTICLFISLCFLLVLVIHEFNSQNKP